MSAPSSNGCLRALALGGALLVGGCQPPPGASAAGDPAPSAGGDTGSVALALTIPPAIQFASISYDLSGNGFHKASSIDVSKSSTFSTIVSGIPLGTGYTAKLTAQDSAHKLTGCAGSATFDLPTATVVAVSIGVQCHEAPVTLPPPSVPVPRGAGGVLAAALLALGVSRVRRPVG